MVGVGPIAYDSRRPCNVADVAVFSSVFLLPVGSCVRARLPRLEPADDIRLPPVVAQAHSCQARKSYGTSRLAYRTAHIHRRPQSVRSPGPVMGALSRPPSPRVLQQPAPMTGNNSCAATGRAPTDRRPTANQQSIGPAPACCSNSQSTAQQRMFFSGQQVECCAPWHLRPCSPCMMLNTVRIIIVLNTSSMMLKARARQHPITIFVLFSADRCNCQCSSRAALPTALTGFHASAALPRHTQWYSNKYTRPH